MEHMDRYRLIGGLIWTALGVIVAGVGVLQGVTVGPIVTALTALTVIAGVAALTRSRWARWVTGRLLGAVIGIELLLSVADRFGLLGAPGAPGVSWGSWPQFLAYVGVLLPWAPSPVVTAAGVVATIAEAALGTLLIIGPLWRWVGKLAAGLLLCFLIAMLPTVGFAEVVRYGVVLQIGAVLIVSARGSWPGRARAARKDETDRWGLSDERAAA
ncbi:hypothetical protein JCM18882A_33160 [Brevibacterium metallidurans]|uniref:DoxX family protein n=2 Tax=Brevibacterium metallidurans TaxID=1482676 RepID=A0ABN0SSY3_9MICO